MRPTSHIFSMLAVLPLGLLNVSQISSAIEKDVIPEAKKPGLVGSWWMTFIEEEGPPTRALFTLGADGTLITSEHPVVTPPGAPGVIFTSSGHGVWNPIDSTEANFTYIGLGSDGKGKLFAIVTFSGSLTLDSAGQSLSGEFAATIADPDGATLATFPMRTKGTRIVVASPAD